MSEWNEGYRTLDDVYAKAKTLLARFSSTEAGSDRYADEFADVFWMVLLLTEEAPR